MSKPLNQTIQVLQWGKNAKKNIEQKKISKQSDSMTDWRRERVTCIFFWHYFLHGRTCSQAKVAGQHHCLCPDFVALSSKKYQIKN